MIHSKKTVRCYLRKRRKIVGRAPGLVEQFKRWVFDKDESSFRDLLDCLKNASITAILFEISRTHLHVTVKDKLIRDGLSSLIAESVASGCEYLSVLGSAVLFLLVMFQTKFVLERLPNFTASSARHWRYAQVLLLCLFFGTVAMTALWSGLIFMSKARFG